MVHSTPRACSDRAVVVTLPFDYVAAGCPQHSTVPVAASLPGSTAAAFVVCHWGQQWPRSKQPSATHEGRRGRCFASGIAFVLGATPQSATW